jgi:DNA (cytosine-5)-methyltransferase 1
MTFAYDSIRALDLFAGTGWGVACDWLGVREDGVDNMPEVIATRDRNGFRTPWHDIRDMPPRVAAAYDLLIASPPCQSFSIAGAGEGRDALTAVLDGVQALSQGREPLRTTPDPRTWLVLEPLRFALAGHPPYILWEQVPTILPVWQACERVLSAHGYVVWTGLMRTEQYGIPQTRTRAVLMATNTRSTILPPPPTTSRYYERQPHRMDAGVGAWVTMQSTLGLDDAEPWLALRSNYGTNGVSAQRGLRFITQPAPTVTTKINRNQWVLADPAGNREKFTPLNQRVSVLQAQELQTYPEDFVFVGGSQNQYLQIGNAVPPLWGYRLIESVLTP